MTLLAAQTPLKVSLAIFVGLFRRNVVPQEDRT